MDGLKKDEASRQDIVSKIDKNYFVEAGAGSGKTDMLVKRMVAMLESSDDIQVEHISAITFTKAAALEFHERFERLLRERSNGVWEDKGQAGQLRKPDDVTIRRSKNALSKIDLCYMGTIDGFCNTIISEHPAEAKVPSDAKLLDSDEALNIYKNYYRRLVKDKSKSVELDKLVKVFSIAHDNPQDVFAQGMFLLMNNKNIEFMFNNVDLDVDIVLQNDKDKLISILSTITRDGIDKFKYQSDKENLAAWNKFTVIVDVLNKPWKDNIAKVISAISDMKPMRVLSKAMEKYLSLADFFEKEDADKKWANFTGGNPGKILEKLLNYQYSVTMMLLHACKSDVEKELKNSGYLSYFDYLYYLREMLKSDAEQSGKLIKYIQRRHKYFLIDEFQDTNPLQAEVFFYLTAQNIDESKHLKSWKECIPYSGSLFIVGDPKQSIYKFRNADIASFEQVKEIFEKTGGEVLKLTQNFRSGEKLRHYFNEVMPTLLVKSKYQSAFEEIPDPVNPKYKDKLNRVGEFQGIYSYEATIGSAINKENMPEPDHIKIANIIDMLVDNPQYLIRTDDVNGLHNIRHKDIMVITSEKDTLYPIMKELHSRNINTRVEGKVDFQTNDALLEVFKIYSAIALGESINLYAALRGKLISLSDNQLLAYKNTAKQLSFSEFIDLTSISDNLVRDVALKLNELNKLFKKSLHLSPAGLFSQILDEYRIFEKVELRDLEVLFYVFELIRDGEITGEITSAKDASIFLETLLNGDSEIERCLTLDKEIDAVHMANLHKVKGLEAPVVILAGEKFKEPNPKIRFEYMGDNPKGYLFALKNLDSYTDYIKTTEFTVELNEERKADEAEAARLLYVAATRGRNALVICDSISSVTKKDGILHSSKWDALRTNSRVVEKDVDKTLVPCLVESEEDKPKEISVSAIYNEHTYTEDDIFLKKRDNEAPTYVLKKPSEEKATSKLNDDDAVSKTPSEDKEIESIVRVKPEYAELHKFGPLLGSMVHKAMEILVSSKDMLKDKQRKTEAEKIAFEVVSEFYVVNSENDKRVFNKFVDAIKEVIEEIRNGGYDQTDVDGLPKDILSLLCKAEQVYCEVPFYYSVLDEKTGLLNLVNGVMDVIYQDSDKKWHIVDYKTNTEIANLKKKYSGQMAAYVEAFKKLMEKTNPNVEVDAKLYHIDI